MVHCVTGVCTPDNVEGTGLKGLGKNPVKLRRRAIQPGPWGQLQTGVKAPGQGQCQRATETSRKQPGWNRSIGQETPPTIPATPGW